MQSSALASTCKQSFIYEIQLVMHCANSQVSSQVSVNCLRMVTAQRFGDISYHGTSAEQADLRRIEIARDMLRVMQEALPGTCK